MRLARTALVLLASTSLGACASLPKAVAWLERPFRGFVHPRPELKLIPVETVTASLPPDEPMYQGAKAAIETRNYAEALDLLQDARAEAPKDVRVLNAFGVVYDKLGRFDLSVRYYEQAKKLDPTSPIVAQNLAYSEMLQKSQRGEAPVGLALATPKYAPGVGGPGVAVGAGAPVLTLAAPEGGGVTLATPALTGHALALVDATGRPGAAEPVRLELAALGWTAPKAAETRAATQARSQIIYARGASIAAAALAKTLPVSVELTACDNGCEGVRLILGADAVSWKDRFARRKA